MKKKSTGNNPESDNDPIERQALMHLISEITDWVVQQASYATRFDMCNICLSEPRHKLHRACRECHNKRRRELKRAAAKSGATACTNCFANIAMQG